MSRDKQERKQQAAATLAERRRRALMSLRLCFTRSEIMRVHHDLLVHEAVDDSAQSFNSSNNKKARFFTYVTYWFAALAATIERFQQLSVNGTIPRSPEVDRLLTPEFIDKVKPFRNAVAHCSDYDDRRVIALLDSHETTPDSAEELAQAFRKYFDTHLPPD